MNTVSIMTPFGRKYVINADYTASGTTYKPIEDFMKENVLKYYANTHSNAHNGQLMSSYIEQSKDLIRKSVGAKPCDNVIFTGNGCTGAIMHIIHLLNLRKKTTPVTKVFVSVAEHHSNYLPWTHLPSDLIIVPVNCDGHINMSFLKDKFQEFANHPKVCSFIAGSNVTGVLQDTVKISKFVHKNNGLIFWDFAGCAPYVRINMHMDDAAYYDAIFMSPHKFLGGPGTPGVLVANYRMFKNSVPFCPGGGTVRFVAEGVKEYTGNLEQRETGGTPNILGCIKAGMVFELKDELIDLIQERELEINARVRGILPKIPNIIMINPKTTGAQVPIYSFRFEKLHYNFVVALLNDVFGIQSRGGVSCCSLFAHYLLKNNKDKQKAIYKQIITNHGVPADYGWCRVTFHYTMPDYVIDYILYAIKYVAIYGEAFLDQYEYNESKNHWTHRGYHIDFPKLSYHSIDRNKVVQLTEDILQDQVDVANEMIS